MKLLNSIIIIILLQSFCTNDDVKVNNPFSPQSTTLDSLQGQWVSINDSAHFLKITGRYLDEVYADESFTKHEFYQLYFSDTLVNGQDYNFSQLKIDTLAITGKYLIKADRAGETVWCYKMNGFYKDGPDTMLSLSDTWVNKRASIFKKL